MEFLCWEKKPRLANQGVCISCFVATHTGRALAENTVCWFAVVGYKIDWHSEIIEDGVTGYLVKTGDCTLFSQLILKVLNNKDLAEKFSKNIRKS